MSNSYFLYTGQGEKVIIERFHICTWEFGDNSALVEFGCEISDSSLKAKNNIDLNLFIPWISQACKVEDFYVKLRDSSNSRFIFNDSIHNTISLDGGNNKNGVVHSFSGRNELCILPITYKYDIINSKIIVQIDLSSYNQYYDNEQERPNIYIRFSVTPYNSYISTRKKGISKSTVLYDIKLNERRNIPETYINEIGGKEFCEVNSCFCFNIIPNSYDLIFFDNSALQNVRTLEYESFNKYLGDKRIKKDELIVVFSKKKNNTPFSFFSIYSKERIGAGQIALAILINFVCGIILFIPSYRQSIDSEISLKNFWYKLPIEIYVVFAIIIIMLGLFIWPSIANFSKTISYSIKSIFSNVDKKRQ